MNFSNEAQLKKMWREVISCPTYSVEPSYGSSFGLSDQIFPLKMFDGRMGFAELKKGTMGEDHNTLSYRVRNKQVDVTKELIENGAVGAFIVAVVGTRIVYAFDPRAPGVLQGKVSLREMHEWAGEERAGGYFGELGKAKEKASWVFFGRKALTLGVGVGMLHLNTIQGEEAEKGG